MPFVPLTPEEQEQHKPPCRDPQHNPPTHMVINHTMKWVCPSCGQTMIIQPPIVASYKGPPDVENSFVVNQ